MKGMAWRGEPMSGGFGRDMAGRVRVWRCAARSGWAARGTVGHAKPGQGEVTL